MTEPIRIDFIGGTPGPKGRFSKNLLYRPAGVHGDPELFGTPGHTSLVTPKYAEVRGLTAQNNYAYAVVGNTLYRIDTNMTATAVTGGTLSTNSGPVCMTFSDTNQKMLLVDTNSNGYYYIAGTNTMAAISDADFTDYSVANGVYCRGYFLCVDYNSNRLFWSDDYDPSVYMADSSSSINAVGDYNMGVGRVGDNVWVFGKTSTEPMVYTTGGSTSFISQRATIETGCIATHSICTGDNAIFWLNNHKEVCRSQGLNYVVISPEELNRKIAGYSRVDDAIFYFMNIQGHGYLVCIFPTENVTWIHDVSVDISQSWAQWVSGIGPNEGRHRSNCYCYFEAANKHLIGDYNNGKISELDFDVFDDDGDYILRERTTPTIQANGKNIRYTSLEITGKRGIGLTEENNSPYPGTDTNSPQGMLDWSDDLEGKIWSNEVWRSLGKIGEYQWESTWGPLGVAKYRSYRFRVSEKVEVTLTGANMRAKALRF